MTASECPHKGNSPVCPKCHRLVPDDCGLQAPTEPASKAPATPVAEEPSEQPEEPLRRRGRPPKVQP